MDSRVYGSIQKLRWKRLHNAKCTYNSMRSHAPRNCDGGNRQRSPGKKCECIDRNHSGERLHRFYGTSGAAIKLQLLFISMRLPDFFDLFFIRSFCGILLWFLPATSSSNGHRAHPALSASGYVDITIPVLCSAHCKSMQVESNSLRSMASYLMRVTYEVWAMSMDCANALQSSIVKVKTRCRV